MKHARGAGHFGYLQHIYSTFVVFIVIIIIIIIDIIVIKCSYSSGAGTVSPFDAAVPRDLVLLTIELKNRY
jgi:hypothetical protein